MDAMRLGGDQWEVLRLPAIAEDPAEATEDMPIEPDPLGRAPGEPLWPEWEPLEELERKRITLGPIDFEALYQQRPQPPAGILFYVDKINHIPFPPQPSMMVRAWDLAATHRAGTNDPDWTVGVLMMRTVDGHYVVLDVQRIRGSPHLMRCRN